MADDVVTGVTLCPVTESQCRCREPAGHDGPHVCPCGGSWRYSGEIMEVISLPRLRMIPGLECWKEW